MPKAAKWGKSASRRQGIEGLLFCAPRVAHNWGTVEPASDSRLFTIVSSQAQTIGSVTLLNKNNRAALLLLACSSVDYHIDSGKRRTDASLLSPVFQTLPHHVVTLNM